MYRTIRLIPVCLLCVFISCEKDDVDGPGGAVDSLTVFPLHYSDVGFLEPLGNLNPPGHTFPTNHAYLYLKRPAAGVPVLAPGDIQLKRIRKDVRSSGGSVTGQDYTLTFSIGGGYLLEFGHVSTLHPDIEALYATSSGRDCSDPYQIDGVQYQYCTVKVNYTVTAGQEIGKAGGQPGQYALDMGVYLADEDPPLNAVCPFTFYEQGQYADIQSRLTDEDPATDAPSSICGIYIFEVAGTAKGLWQKSGKPLYPEENHLALVENNRDPGQPVFSIGVSQTGLASGAYAYVVQNSGVINRRFEDITADGQTYCFDIDQWWDPGATGSLLLRMADVRNLALEYRSGCDCSCDTDYSFSSNKVTYRKPEL